MESMGFLIYLEIWTLTHLQEHVLQCFHGHAHCDKVNTDMARECNGSLM